MMVLATAGGWVGARLAKRLPVPAYDHLLKLSHTFNLLDARGAVGVTESANRFATMRALAREVTGARRSARRLPLCRRSAVLLWSCLFVWRARCRPFFFLFLFLFLR